MSSDFVIFLWVPQKVHDLPQLSFSFFGSGDVLKGNLGVMTLMTASFASPKAKDTGLALARLASHPDHQSNQKDHGQGAGQQGR
jgi:hypothetical protein